MKRYFQLYAVLSVLKRLKDFVKADSTGES